MFKDIHEIEALICRLMDKLDAGETDSLELEIKDVKISLGKHKKPPHHEQPFHGMPHMPMYAQPAVTMHSAPVADPTASEAVTEAAINGKAEALATVNAPLIGVAYAASSPEAAPFVKVGDKVKKGDIICIIEAMKVMNEIESDRDGEIVEILFENGKMVEFGQPLVSVK